MLREMSRIELSVRLAHLKVGSLDDEANDWRLAVLASAVRNAPHFMKDGKQPYTPQDFLPRHHAPVEQQIKAFLIPRMKKEK